MMLVAARTNVEILIDLAFEQHFLAALTFYKQTFCANGSLFVIVRLLWSVFFLEPGHRKFMISDVPELLTRQQSLRSVAEVRHLLGNTGAVIHGTRKNEQQI